MTQKRTVVNGVIKYSDSIPLWQLVFARWRGDPGDLTMQCFRTFQN